MNIIQMKLLIKFMLIKKMYFKVLGKEKSGRSKISAFFNFYETYLILIVSNKYKRL